MCVYGYLQTGHPGWQYKSLVVSMDHSKDTDGSCCDSPGILESQLLLSRLLWILKHNLKHLGEVLTKMVGGSSLRKLQVIKSTHEKKEKKIVINLFCLFLCLSLLIIENSHIWPKLNNCTVMFGLPFKWMRVLS